MRTDLERPRDCDPWYRLRTGKTTSVTEREVKRPFRLQYRYTHTQSGHSHYSKLSIAFELGFESR